MSASVTGTIDRPPLVLTANRPEDIIGKENMEIFTAHMRICYSSVHSGEFPEKRLNKEIGPGNREFVAMALGELRRHGFTPAGLNERDRVRWHVVTRPVYLDLFENEEYEKFKGMSQEECMRIGREGWHSLIDGVRIPKVEDHEMSLQQGTK